jgi:signal transduction histidine kinase
METPTLRKLLEPDKTSALLANFAQTFHGALQICLVDLEGQIIGCHPHNFKQIDAKKLSAVVKQVQQFDRLTSVTLGLAAPVRARGKVIGVLVATGPETLQTKEAAMLRLLARILSLLAEKGMAQEELLQETLNRYREINLLYYMGETIAASLDLSEVNRLLLQESTRLTQADEGAVMLVDHDSNQLTVWASRGLDAVEDIGAGIPLGHELAEQVAQDGKTRLVEKPKPGRNKRPLTALLCVPLKTKDRIIGVISLAHTGTGKSFRNNDVRLLNAIAGQAAVTIDNARMFSDLSALHLELGQANRRLRDLDKLKSSFLGVITHELRSPLANIDFSLQVIERYGTMDWLEAQQEQWTQLARLVQEARGMIDNLISFAGLLSKGGDLTLTPVSLSALTHEITDNLAPVADSRQVALHVAPSNGVPSIMADEARLSEAIYHLIHNAIKFNQAGGTVQIRCWAEDGGVTFEVEDTGTGIPAEKLKLLGDPFSQVADPVKRGVEGLGLGLALVKYVVRAHGGQMDISSQEGVGSRFRFWLPLKQKSSLPTPQDA